MATNKEIDKDMADRLFELLIIEKMNKGYKVKGLDRSIRRAKAAMTKESIAWVEEQVAAEGDEG